MASSVGHFRLRPGCTKNGMMDGDGTARVESENLHMYGDLFAFL